ncbi:MAG: tetratricopeptide repeat protein [Dokdonella sp.]
MATIRAVDDATSLQVTPLRDAAVEGLLAQAQADEAKRHYDDAFTAIGRARKLAPDAPDLIQFAAEIELLRGNTQQAERLAVESWRKGPKLGVLCERNWQTVIEARKIFNDPAYQATAAAYQAQCKVPAPVRM